MTEEEFRTDLGASAAARAEAHGMSLRDGLVMEVLERLRDAGEVPDFETCSETLTGSNRRRLELDAFAFDEADDSLHLFQAIEGGQAPEPLPLGLAEARSQGFDRLLNVFEQSRDGWLVTNTEESRPIWQLAKRIQTGGRLSALRLHVLSDRPVSRALKEIAADTSKEGVPIFFHIWDLSRLQRVHEARNARDELVVDLSSLPGGGLTMLRAAAGEGEYSGYLAVVSGEALADIYIRHGSRLLEGNVRTFLGRRGKINQGIATTIAKEPSSFFAFNNGIAATASSVERSERPDGSILVTAITDLQIVNGAQTTASLASLHRERKLPLGQIHVPMKLSVVGSKEIGDELIPKIARYANRQNTVRDSDFFANHPFHKRMEDISRRIRAPAVKGSLTQTHWFYERARGQHLNGQAGLSAAKIAQFLRENPREQIITKTDMAKVESCFDLLPDTASKGAEKAFVEFAARVTEHWKDESKRDTYSDDWFRSAVARNIIFRRAEALISAAPWYEGGYRAQAVAYTLARLAKLADEVARGGSLDYLRVWKSQKTDDLLDQQLLAVAEVMMGILRNPPMAGQNISEWAKQQACRKQALDASVAVVDGFDAWLIDRDEVKAAKKDERERQQISDGLEALTEVLNSGAAFWTALRLFAKAKRLALPEDEQALAYACQLPTKVPSERQAMRLLALREKCRAVGYEDASQ